MFTNVAWSRLGVAKNSCPFVVVCPKGLETTIYPYRLQNLASFVEMYSVIQWKAYKGTSSIGSHTCPRHRMRCYASDNEQIPHVSILFFSNHSGTS